MTGSVVNGFQFITLSNVRAFLVAQTINHLPATQETEVPSLGREDPLEKEMANPLQYSCLKNSMDCSLSGSSVHGIFQARVLERIAISFSRGSSRSRNQTWVSCVAGRCFTV